MNFFFFFSCEMILFSFSRHSFFCIGRRFFYFIFFFTFIQRLDDFCQRGFRGIQIIGGGIHIYTYTCCASSYLYYFSVSLTAIFFIYWQDFFLLFHSF
ncbi:hypothetical protein QBC42DRAFT_262077 [Cladorrhinum samala]|uniref:Uncharacterized protein n=1 Tax=Cladorrhinum samala TaxID=585594 RepID=A0AAV9HW41_9PEZI|nr:hypothetical protein QBC42DRAFT_262077 [Cladorrhinum samala]